MLWTLLWMFRVAIRIPPCASPPASMCLPGTFRICRLCCYWSRAETKCPLLSSARKLIMAGVALLPVPAAGMKYDRPK